MNKIAILYLCTGDYAYFWKDFFNSFDEKFLPNTEKHYYVWTDSEHIFAEDDERIHKIYKECLGFPNETLMRFHTFDTIREELERYNYIFFFNSNCICSDTITEEEFLPNEQEILVVKHAMYRGYSNEKLPYERDCQSTAYIPFGDGNVYALGAVNGGPASIYLSMIQTLKQNIDQDLRNDFVAIWHDESHLNKYITDSNVKCKVLGPEYGYFEDFCKLFPELNEKILLLDKSKYIDIATIKRSVPALNKKYDFRPKGPNIIKARR